ncbi:Uncharacterised protein [Vibrio cholerae]|nr:Uncharacterised protein [Vibrio cholerae]
MLCILVEKVEREITLHIQWMHTTRSIHLRERLDHREHLRERIKRNANRE